MSKKLDQLLLPYCNVQNFRKLVICIAALAGDGISVCNQDLGELLYCDIFKEEENDALYDLIEKEVEKIGQ